jgi:hypothetical protein
LGKELPQIKRKRWRNSFENETEFSLIWEFFVLKPFKWYFLFQRRSIGGTCGSRFGNGSIDAFQGLPFVLPGLK